ncbi:MAG: hypothetical protein H6679_05860 [Epsilonproteobacteria bacterium]|nr:hypothetical protein [Campylobacterota bacterium]
MSKKLFMVISVLVNITLVFGCMYLYYARQIQDPQNDVELTVVDGKEYKVAVVIPLTHPSLEEIVHGFTDTLVSQYKLNCTFTTFNGNGNRSLLRSQVEEVVQGQYDLVFTVGLLATQLTKEIMGKKQKPTPVVFAAVDLPALALTQRDKDYVTGVLSDDDEQWQVHMLKTLKPDMKRVLLVADPALCAGYEQKKETLHKTLEQYGAELRTLEVYKTSEIYERASSMIEDADVVLVLKDHSVVSGIDSLIKLCNRSQVTLCTSELDSVVKGAAVGFGATSFGFGKDSAAKAKHMLVDGSKAGDLPIIKPSDYKIRINKKSMLQQGLQLSEQIKFLITATEFVE